MGKGVRDEGGDTCILMADSHCCTVETNTALKGNYIPINKLKKQKQVPLPCCHSESSLYGVSGCG